jgi:hypothetical protein
MQLYADRATVRVRQVLADLLTVGGVWVGVAVALELRRSIAGLDGVGRQLERSGRTVTQGADRAVETVGGIPTVGDALAAPFGTIGGAGRQLSAAGLQVTETVATLAVLVPAVLLGLVLGALLFRVLPRRVAWVREVAEVRRLLTLPDAERLLAHRAVATRPLRELRRLAGDEAAAWFAEERFRPLAAIELRALGLDPGRLERNGDLGRREG